MEKIAQAKNTRNTMIRSMKKISKFRIQISESKIEIRVLSTRIGIENHKFHECLHKRFYLLKQKYLYILSNVLWLIMMMTMIITSKKICY